SGANVSLVAVKDGNSHTNIGKALQSDRFSVGLGQQLAVLFHAAPDLQVGNRFPPGAGQGCFRSFDSEFGDSYGWTLVDDLLHQFIRIDWRSVLQFSFEPHQKKSRVAQHSRA